VISTSEPKEISQEEASSIIETREPQGLFYLKDGNVYVGIDNRTHDAWTEEFPTKEQCLQWLQNYDEY